jgi:hypothetical protein
MVRFIGAPATNRVADRASANAFSATGRSRVHEIPGFADRPRDRGAFVEGHENKQPSMGVSPPGQRDSLPFLPDESAPRVRVVASTRGVRAGRRESNPRTVMDDCDPA